MTRMMIKKRPPADPLLRRSNRAELRRPLSTLGRLYKVFAYCVFYSAFFRISRAVSASWSARRRPVCIIYLCFCSDEPAVEDL